MDVAVHNLLNSLVTSILQISRTEILVNMFNFCGLLATESTFEQLLGSQSLIICNLGLPFI